MASASKLPIVATPKKSVPLSNVQPGDEGSTVLVKVLRKWYVLGKHGGNKPMSLELALVDSEGTTIQGHLDRMHIYKHERQLHEGHVYAISKFVVTSNVGEFRASRHNYRLNINYHTIIRPAARSDSIRNPDFVFTPPAECLAREFNTNYLVDVSGILTGLQPEYEFTKGNRTSSRMKIEMDNRGFRYTVQLFGEYVQEVKKLVSSPDGNNVVLVFLWAKVDDWNGGRQLQTSMHTTRLLINPLIPETALLKETISSLSNSPTLTLSQGSKSVGQMDEFLKVDEKHTILLVKEAFEVNNFVILASVDSILNEDDWWYLACSCHKKVIADSDMYYCDKCNIHVTDVTRKYFLKLRIIDESDSLVVVVFDQAARILLGRSADDVYDSWMQDAERDYVPTKLLGLPGKQALWNIQSENYKGGRFPRQYLARNVTDDRTIIEQYQLQWVNTEEVVDAPHEVFLIENTPTSVNDSVQQLSQGVSQDLIARFDQTTSDTNSAIRENKTVDITKDHDDTPPLKRKSPADKCSSSATVPLKTVKVEKKE